MIYEEVLKDKVGKKVFVKRKSSPDYTIIGILSTVDGGKMHIESDSDVYIVDYEDILSLDVKNKPKELVTTPIGTLKTGTTAKVEGTLSLFSDVNHLQEKTVLYATLTDSSGSCTISFWNEQINEVQEGDRIIITEGKVLEGREGILVNKTRNGKILIE